MKDRLTFLQALKRAEVVYVNFGCANGATIKFRATKKQVREITGAARPENVFSNDNPDSTANWFLYDDGSLYLHFLT